MNLWDDFDNQQTPVESARHKSTRRLTDKLIVSSLRQWLLQDYASSYCRSLAASGIYRRCYWIDAWDSDTGGDRSEILSAKGHYAPILQEIAALSQVLAEENRAIALNGIVLKADSSRRKEARAIDNKDAGERSIPPSEREKMPSFQKGSGIVRASWLEIAPTLLKEFEHSPAIFLLNPFGHTLFTYDELALLYQRTSAPTELGLLIPHKQAEMRLMAASQTPAHAQALTSLLHTDRWKALLPKGEKATFSPGGIVDLLLSSMQQHFLWVQPIAFPIQTRPAVVEAAPYTLLFATRSKDSLVSMNDAVCGYRRRLYLQSRQGVLGEEWFARQEEERLREEIRRLCQQALQLGQTQRTRRWPDLRQQLLLANFGQFMHREYDEVIGELLQQGDVRCEWKRRLTEEEGMRVPGNEDTLLWK